jgi:hypothetical protein
VPSARLLALLLQIKCHRPHEALDLCHPRSPSSRVLERYRTCGVPFEDFFHGLVIKNQDINALRSPARMLSWLTACRIPYVEDRRIQLLSALGPRSCRVPAGEAQEMSGQGLPATMETPLFGNRPGSSCHPRATKLLEERTGLTLNPARSGPDGPGRQDGATP